MNSTTGYATTFLLSIFSPIVVALITRPKMNSNLKLLIAIVISALCVAAGQFFDGQFQFPPSSSFWIILLATFGAQQVSYNLAKDQIIRPVEAATATP